MESQKVNIIKVKSKQTLDKTFFTSGLEKSIDSLFLVVFNHNLLYTSQTILGRYIIRFFLIFSFNFFSFNFFSLKVIEFSSRSRVD
ncbi:MAG: hypothetical protein P1U46_02075 [Patescibacteria group bacterium]|nr:hypothetical protein [Patescibacteria group bacterium]